MKHGKQRSCQARHRVGKRIPTKSCSIHQTHTTGSNTMRFLSVCSLQLALIHTPANKHTMQALLLVGCLTSQQHASVSQGRICSDNFTCCHTAIEVADQTFHLTQSQYTDTGPTSPRADPITPGAWQGSCWSANF